MTSRLEIPVLASGDAPCYLKINRLQSETGSQFPWLHPSPPPGSARTLRTARGAREGWPQGEPPAVGATAFSAPWCLAGRCQPITGVWNPRDSGPVPSCVNQVFSLQRKKPGWPNFQGAKRVAKGIGFLHVSPSLMVRSFLQGKKHIS